MVIRLRFGYLLGNFNKIFLFARIAPKSDLVLINIFVPWCFQNIDNSIFQFLIRSSFTQLSILFFDSFFICLPTVKFATRKQNSVHSLKTNFYLCIVSSFFFIIPLYFASLVSSIEEIPHLLVIYLKVSSLVHAVLDICVNYGFLKWNFSCSSQE